MSAPLNVTQFGQHQAQHESGGNCPLCALEADRYASMSPVPSIRRYKGKHEKAS